MSNALTASAGASDVMERVLIAGDLAALSPDDRVRYYSALCESVGLNPLTRPFEYIRLNGKLVLYAKRDATVQLRRFTASASASPRPYSPTVS